MSTSLFDVLKSSEILTQEELVSFFDVLPENPDKLESFFLENELVTEKSLMGLKVLQQGFGTLSKSNSSRIFTNPERLKHLAHHIYQEKVSASEKVAAEKAAAEKAAAEKAAAEKAAAEKAAAEKAAAEKAAAEKAAAEKAAAEKAAAEKAAAEKAAAEKAAAEKAAAEKAAAEKAAAEKVAAEKVAAEITQSVQRAQNYPDTGDILGKCQLTSVLGSGATSRVFMGFHSFLRKSVAIKVLSPRLASQSSDAETLFLNEAINTARLDHRNLVRVLDADRSQSYTYMIMEYIDGPTLKELLERSGAIKPLNAIRIIQEVLKALKYASGFRLIHRDIKPGNIMLTRSGEVKLADLGLAKIVDSPDVYQTTSMGTIHGTPYYMPPEQDAEDLDLRGDMYSLGATLYHLVTGELPFSGDSIPQIIYKHLYEAPVPPEQKNSDVGAELSKVILKLMEKKPEDRYQTYDELIDVFDKLETCYENGHEEESHTHGETASDTSLESDNAPTKKKGFFKSIFGI